MAYPDFINDVTKKEIIWHDGAKMPLGDSEDLRSCLERLRNPSLYNQIVPTYQPGLQAMEDAEKNKDDPGRFRVQSFFKKMYGSSKEEVESHLVEIEWLPKSLQVSLPDGTTTSYKIRVTKINGVSDKLGKISQELDNLPDTYKKYLANPGGTYCWRTIAGTDRISAHSFGMTIDINVEYSNYWIWDYKQEQKLPRYFNVREDEVDEEQFPRYTNNIPFSIVEIFEKHNFIWGGKWRHYDTMHFEYRPEQFATYKIKQQIDDN